RRLRRRPQSFAAHLRHGAVLLAPRRQLPPEALDTDQLHPSGRRHPLAHLRCPGPGVNPGRPQPFHPLPHPRAVRLMTSRYWSDLVTGLDPYVPGEQPKIANQVKLNTNENPFGPSPRVLEAIRAATGDNLRLYPPPDADSL